MARSYHHGNLRPALVDTAVGLARSGGADAVVLREVARRAGVSHNAAYRHFADKEQLLGEVSQRAMDQLERAMREGIAAVRVRDRARRARAELHAVGRAYVEFALAEPGLFTVAFVGHGAAPDDPARAAAPADPADPDPADPDPASPATPADQGAVGPFALLNSVLDAMVEAGAMPAERRPGAEVACWASVHGFAMLHLEGPLCDASAADREATMTLMLDTVERGLSAAGAPR